MMRRCKTVVLLALVCSPRLAVGQATYFQEVQRAGDSAFLVFLHSNFSAIYGMKSGDTSGTTKMKANVEAAKQFKALVGDFEAIVPPEQLAKVHDQMVGALRSLSFPLDTAGLLALYCQGRVSTCDNFTWRVDRLLVPSVKAQKDYVEARNRLYRMSAGAIDSLPSGFGTKDDPVAARRP